MRHEYTAIIKKEGRWYVAWLKEVPGVNTQGRTLAEVQNNLKEALMLVLEERHALSTIQKRNMHKGRVHIAMPHVVGA